MNIIEREIKERLDLIESVDVKKANIVELERQLAEEKASIENIDVETLTAEIEELKSYLPKTEEEPNTTEQTNY